MVFSFPLRESAKRATTCTNKYVPDHADGIDRITGQFAELLPISNLKVQMLSGMSTISVQRLELSPGRSRSMQTSEL